MAMKFEIKYPSWYVKSLTQIILVGLAAFCCPGLFNALSGLGGAGNENASFANSANATLYACFAVFGYFGGMAFNFFGNRLMMMIGGFTYAVYAGTQYAAGTIPSAGWAAPFGGAILGIGAGWFWTAQGAMMLAYSTPASRGRFIAIFWVIFNLGGMVGGFISFGVNFNSSGGTADPTTYFIFIALMCLGAIGSGLLLCPPEKVVREDGHPVMFEKASDFVTEMKGLGRASKEANMLFLFLLFFVSNFAYTYQFNGMNGILFSVRSRGFNSAFYWGAQMFGSVAISFFLDWKSWSLRKRGVIGWIIVFIEFNICWALACYLQYGYEGGYDKGHKPDPAIDDFTDGRRAAFPVVLFILFGIGDSILQTFAYWLMGALARGHTEVAARYTGFYKGVQSAGAAVAWGIDLKDKITYTDQFWVNWALFLAAMVLAAVTVYRLQSKSAEESFESSITQAKDIATDASASVDSTVMSRVPSDQPAAVIADQPVAVIAVVET